MASRGLTVDAPRPADLADGLYARHVREINRFIDGLQRPEDGLWAPHIGPLHAHTPTVLSVLRDPGNGAHHARVCCTDR